MSQITQETRFEIGEREVLELRRACGQELVCATGELWITAAGSPDDIILRPGERWHVPTNAALVVSAFRRAVLVTRQVLEPCDRGAALAWR
ncbi:MAG: DUF2917 domain-containing protein [Betaproteobacteria bacterium]|nr:DUF2917 domain-containing protein [Betaproteobacteria bacterium]